ncbi:MAG: histidinol dehydrogenase [Candidatus Nanopelagicales bacterium]
MLRRIDLTADEPFDVPRALPEGESAAVSHIIDDVRSRGAEAVLDFGQRFDGVRPATLRVPAEVIAAAEVNLDPAVRAALLTAIERTTTVHTDQLPEPRTTQLGPGAIVRQTWRPVRRVGLYVPGGRAVYPSSVVMNVVPARVAGVESMAVVSPPQIDNDGWPHPTILAACALLGIDEVYAAGGAQAVAMLALGVQGVPAVNVITGPGNIYVTEAKRLLRGSVGIDSEAGPTEIAIVADDTADAALVAADLISQAEHDVVAASVLITDSRELVDAVDAELAVQVAATKHSERIEIALSGRQSAAVITSGLEQSLACADTYAAEHLEIHTRDAAQDAARISNAGAIFVGPHSPVSLGDYLAGSNHVLPTAGCACHSSGLNVTTFLRSVQVIEYDAAALEQVTDQVLALAIAEDLPAHGRAVTIRRERP